MKEGNEVKELKEVKESKENPFPVHMRIGAFSGPLFPLPPQLPSLPLLLRKFLTIRLAASLAALATFTPILFAQAAQPQGTTNAPSAASSTPNALSHDLGGVWMQYPDERVGGVPIVT